MPVPLIVPDASVILKWVLPSDNEPDSEKAAGLRDSILNDNVRVLVPALWLYEVGNTIARRLPEHAAAWMTAVIKFELEESTASPQWLETTLKLTEQYGVTFYDAAYHAVAIVQKGLFVTADTRYVRQVNGAGSVVALSDWVPA